MKLIDAHAVEAALDFPSLVDRLRETFRDGAVTPLRHNHPVEMPAGEPGANLLLMPAWRSAEIIAVKMVTVFPGNAANGLSAINAAVVVFDGATGQPTAYLDGEAVTVRRTAAASALAATYLAREDAETLAMMGTGGLAPNLIRAHAAVRPIRRVIVWGRTFAKAQALADLIRSEDGLEAEAVAERKDAASEADIVSCATLSADPLVEGAWVKPGAHIDLVGAFRPDLRESDDAVMARGRIFVDTEDGALAEAGDLVQPLQSGAIARSDVVGDLFGLCRETVEGRTSAEEITVFKSVGTALEDLGAAQLVVERVGG